MTQYIPLSATNRAQGQLFASASASAVTFLLNAGEGAVFPQTINGAADSVGTSTVLNSTGIGASGIAVGDILYNVTDGSFGVVLAVTTNSVTTRPLQGGTANIWDDLDEYAVNPFVVTMNTRTTSGAVDQYEDVLIYKRTADTLECKASGPSAGRSFNGTTAQNWDASTYVSLFVNASNPNELRDGLANLARHKAEDSEVVKLTGAQTIAGIKTFSDIPKTPVDPTVADDLVRKGWIDANIVAAGLLTGTAGETILQDEACYIATNGKFKRATVNFTDVDDVDVRTGVGIQYASRVIELEPFKFLVVWSENNGGTFEINCRVATLDQSTGQWSLGTTLLLNNLGTSYIQGMAIAKVNNTKVRVVSFVQGSITVYGHVIGISGTTCSKDAEVTETSTYPSLLSFDFIQDASGNLVVSTSELSGSTYYPYVYWFDGDTFTKSVQNVGSYAIANNGNAYRYYTSRPVVLDATRVLVGVPQGTATLQPRLVILSKSNPSIAEVDMVNYTNSTSVNLRYKLMLVPFETGNPNIFRVAAGNTLNQYYRVWEVDITGNTFSDQSGSDQLGLNGWNNGWAFSTTHVGIAPKNITYFATTTYDIYGARYNGDGTISVETQVMQNVATNPYGHVATVEGDVYHLAAIHGSTQNLFNKRGSTGAKAIMVAKTNQILNDSIDCSTAGGTHVVSTPLEATPGARFISKNQIVMGVHKTDTDVQITKAYP